jgi:hypothetical protein
MRRDDTEWERPYTSGDVVDDIIDWAGKLKVLGEVWGTLSWHEKSGHGSTDILENSGEILGSIITDYAELIENTISHSHKNGEIIVNSLKRYEETLQWIENSKGQGGSAGVIDLDMQSLDRFIATVTQPAYLMKKRFAEMKKKYPIKHETASETVSAASEA